MPKHDVETYRRKLIEWNPAWNVESWTNRQVIAIYMKEEKKHVAAILRFYGLEGKI